MKLIGAFRSIRSVSGDRDALGGSGSWRANHACVCCQFSCRSLPRISPAIFRFEFEQILSLLKVTFDPASQCTVVENFWFSPI